MSVHSFTVITCDSAGPDGVSMCQNNFSSPQYRTPADARLAAIRSYWLFGDDVLCPAHHAQAAREHPVEVDS